MGCDIHCYIQYKTKDDEDKWWRSFGGELNPGRNYLMFGVLAGVRFRGIPGSFSPKGVLPAEKQSWKVQDDLYLYITDDGEGENETTLESAKTWFGGREIVNDNDGKPFKVRHPDWHSHSWMTIKEVETAFKVYKKNAKKEDYYSNIPLEYKAILKLMKALEDEGKNEVLLIFWFDN